MTKATCFAALATLLAFGCGSCGSAGPGGTGGTGGTGGPGGPGGTGGTGGTGGPENAVIVDVTPDIGQTWTLTGPSYPGGYAGAGDETLPGLDPGAYTVAFDADIEYDAPPDDGGTLVSGGTLTLSGVYVAKNTGDITVTPSQAAATWTLVGRGYNSGTQTGTQTLAGLAYGQYTATFDDNVLAFSNPAPVEDTLGAPTLDLSGTYAARAPYTVHVAIRADGGAPGADFGSWSITQNEGLAFSASGDGDTNVSPVVPSSGDFYAGRAYTLAFQLESGYATPANVAITSAGTFIGDYVPTVGISKNVMFVGHSLLDQAEKDCFISIAQSLGHTCTARSQHIPGAPLRVNWSDTGSGPPEEQADAVAELATGNFDTLIMTETIPIITYAPSPNETTLYGGLFFNLAKDSNPATQVYLYETWVWTCAGTDGCGEGDLDGDPQTFREHLDADTAIWQGPVDAINAASAHDGLALMPIGSKYFTRFYDEVYLGNMTGFTDIDDIIFPFPDQIHPYNKVRYMWALAMVAEVYDIDIRGATTDCRNIADEPVAGMPTAEQAGEMQALVYDVWSANR